ncbi:hypothetical protein DENSPDRAFT_772604 [Dentipellis sp. KUC8613]|nr:hypothetical protein DENSPDRAFT_772604 [Dentipellis sp. KUC8613]
MRFSTVLAAALPIAAVSAANFQVQVGANGGLAYDPPMVNASVGDTISFVFMAKNHTVTQSTFAAPCENMTNGIDSGFQPVAAGATSLPSWSFTVNDTSAPLWFYCRQTGHCQKGMVFAVNPTAAKTFANFQAAANNSQADGTPAASPSGSGSAPAASGSGSPAASGSGASPSASGTSSNASGAMANGVRAGSLLAAIGFAAGLLL